MGAFELVRVLRRSLTLGARLTMNMVAGKLILCIGARFLGSAIVRGRLLSFAGLTFIVRMLVLASWEMVVGVIQRFILVFLTIQYLGEAPLK